MDIDALTTNIKPLDLSINPACSVNEQEYFRHYNLNFEEKYPDITHYFGHFPCGRFDIVAHYFQNKNAVATCFILHGYYDHAGLYGHIINHCIEKNLSVIIYDLPGHGLSTGKSACITEFSDYLAVLKSVIAQFSHSIPKPWYIIAQSTGGAILMDYLLTEQAPPFSKAVLLAPLVRPVKWKKSVVIFNLVKYFLKRVPRNFSASSNDETFLSFVKNSDPLQPRYLSLRWVAALIRWIKHYEALAPCEHSPLLIQGQQDETVDWQYNIPMIKNKFPTAKMLYLKNAKHHLVNEREDIRNKMLSAIDMYFNATQEVAATPLNN